MKSNICSSETLASLMVFPSFSEPGLEDALESSSNGVFIGCTKKQGMPFFLNPGVAVNPHMFVCGMSGSGKTYLTRTLVLKLARILNHRIVIIDFTGEYLEFARFAGCLSCNLDELGQNLEEVEQDIVYLGLSQFRDREKVRISTRAVEKITQYMRTRRIGSNECLFVVLDEAWKLLLGSDSLSTIIREGRKYGVGLILASQLIEDIELSILGNIATIFVFRMQNIESLAKLKHNYQLSEETFSAVQNLQTGGNIVIQIRKDGLIDSFQISRVSGITVPRIICLKIGGRMVSVEYAKMEKMVKRIAKKESGELLSRMNTEKEIPLQELVSELLLLDAERIAVLEELRNIGLDDGELADSFAAALNDTESGKKDDE